jgi:hypothetical protein
VGPYTLEDFVAVILQEPILAARERIDISTRTRCVLLQLVPDAKLSIALKLLGPELASAL